MFRVALYLNIADYVQTARAEMPLCLTLDGFKHRSKSTSPTAANLPSCLPTARNDTRTTPTAMRTTRKTSCYPPLATLRLPNPAQRPQSPLPLPRSWTRASTTRTLAFEAHSPASIHRRSRLDRVLHARWGPRGEAEAPGHIRVKVGGSSQSKGLWSRLVIRELSTVFHVISICRYSKEHKYRPAASPIITETLRDGRIRLRGAIPPTATPTPRW